MPFGNDGTSRERVEANNKVAIPDGTRPGDVADIWLYNIEEVNENGRTRRKYSPHPSHEQDCEVKVRFDARPDIVLSRTFPVYPGDKAKFAQFIRGLYGFKSRDELIDYLMPEGHPSGEPLSADEAKAITKKLRHDFIGKKVLITTKRKEGSEYTNVDNIGPRPVMEGDDLAAIPMQRNPGLSDKPQTAAQQASEAHEGPSWDDLDEIPF